MKINVVDSWEKFLKSGKVVDYITYKKARSNMTNDSESDKSLVEIASEFTDAAFEAQSRKDSHDAKASRDHPKNN